VRAGRVQPRGGCASTSWTRLPLLRACHSIALRLDAAAPQPGDQVAEHPPTDVPPQEPSGEPAGVRVASHRREQVRQR
jgi:hypothetical protein